MLAASVGEADRAPPARMRRRVRTCKTCVRRRVLCDATYPKCRKCVDGGLECPGVLEPLSFVFRDETQSLQRRSNNHTPPPQQPPEPPDPLALAAASAKGPSEAVLRELKLSTADFAKGLFLQGHPNILRASGIADPFFECLKPVLSGNLDLQVHVSLSADAVSLAALGQSTDRNDILQSATETYGEALKATQMALYDPQTAASDATLTAVKLLMAYEFLTSKTAGATAWVQHVFGQLAIALQRGSDGFTTPAQLELLYTTFLHNALCAMYSGTPLAAPPGGWLPRPATNDPPRSLLRLTSEVVDLRAKSSSLHARPDADPHKMPEMHQLLQRTEIVLDALAAWHNDLPTTWSRHEIDARYRADMRDLERCEIWPGPLAVYRSLHVAHYYNLNRIDRVYALTVVVRALFWLELQHGGRTPATSEHVRQRLGQLYATVGEVCADVPYYLGLRQLPKDLRHLQIDRMGLNGKGGVSLWVWIFTCMSVEGVPEEQRAWMRGRMRFIGDEVKYTWAAWLADNTAQTLIFDAQTNQVCELLNVFFNGVTPVPSPPLPPRTDGDGITPPWG